jgi:acyl-CoA hydrolase
MRPILVQIAQETEFVIQHISEKPSLLAHPDYRDALENKLELANQLARLTDDSVDYAEAKAGSATSRQARIELTP